MIVTGSVFRLIASLYFCFAVPKLNIKLEFSVRLCFSCIFALY